MAAAEGVSPYTLTGLTNLGLLRRPIKSVYLASQAGDSIDLRAQCLSLVVPEGCVVAGRHAGWAVGAEMVLAPGEHLELQPLVVVRHAGMGRLRNKLSESGERTFRPDEITRWHGLSITTPLRTAWDLGRWEHRDRAIAGLDAMLALRRFSREELLAGVERFAKQRHVRQLRSLAPLADGRAQSPPESVLRLRWLDCGLPAPEPQLALVRNGIVVAYLDLGERTARFAVEYDGVEWHTSPDQRRHDRARRSMAEREFGYLVEVVTRHNLFGTLRDVEGILNEGYRRARQRQGLTIRGR